MLEQLVYPLRWHHQAPLPILEVLLTRVAPLASLLDHALHLVRMESVQHLEKEIPLWELVVPVGQVIKDINPKTPKPQALIDTIKISKNFHKMKKIQSYPQ